MIFSKETYIQRRSELKKRLGGGLLLFLGNNNSPANYAANAYVFRQDSTFLYYFGLNQEGLVGIIDIDNNREWLLGDDVDLEDIIWTGAVPSISDLASEIGICTSAPLSHLEKIVSSARSKGQKIHFLPPYRHDHIITLSHLLSLTPSEVCTSASVDLIKAVVAMRSVKSDEEVEEMERACAIGYKMHTAAMKACREGVTEKYIEGLIGGICESYGSMVSFRSIVSIHGEIFHGSSSMHPLEKGRLMLCDAGAETMNHYCSDHTRVTPVSGKFSSRQRDIYSIVEACHDLVFEKARPGVKWVDVHLDVCRLMTDRLKSLGLMKGDTEDAVQAGAHAMFLPHGLGHMIGMDVHDMESLGQEYVGFDDEVRPSSQFGTNCLRCGRRVQAGFVLSDEPGIYFIPALIDRWKATGMHKDFICYDKLEKYRDFGGIRLEDDVLITADGCRMLGKEVIPYHIDDVEAFVG